MALGPQVWKVEAILHERVQRKTTRNVKTTGILREASPTNPVGSQPQISSSLQIVRTRTQAHDQYLAGVDWVSSGKVAAWISTLYPL
mmetsp:Transcript_152563/g.266400  ORF Transcript_152563/g.266400 Transcript_152563/m.266400 type:complete len:87 (+) Transcript_152563:123-383(+)